MTDQHLFDSDIQAQHNKVKDTDLGKLIISSRRIAQKQAEVLVKVSSYGKGRDRVAAHLKYISRDNDLPLEDPTGNRLESRQEQDELLDHWYADADTRKNARTTAHIVLSAPADSNRLDVEEAARRFARKRFADNHDYLFAMHSDTDHPHAHLVVKLRGYDGEKLRLGKKALFELREHFAESLRSVGIAATASYRSQRGVGRKAESQPLRHMKSKGVIPEVEKQALAEAVADLKGQKTARPWEDALRRRFEKTQAGYRELANTVRGQGSEAAESIARELETYAASMAAPKTRHEELKSAILQKARATRRQQAESTRADPER